jgi:hypothetical protein
MPEGTKTKAVMSEVGSTGLNITGGMITTDEIIPELQGEQAMKTYRQMSDNDPIIGAVLFAIEMLIRHVTWRVEPFSADPKHVEEAEFLESCMHDMQMTWDDTITEANSMMIFGWSALEIVYKRRDGWKDGEDTSKFKDGKVGWKYLPIRGQDTLVRWDTTEADPTKIKGLVQQPPPQYREITIPMEKLLLFRTKTHKSSPEGRSVLRNAYRPWYFKRRMEEIEGIGVERDLAGLPVAYVDPEIMMDTATPQQKAIYNMVKDIVQNIRRDRQEGIVWPMEYDADGNQQYKLELMSAGGSRQFNTGEIIDRYNKQIAMCVLADFILLGHEGVGSFALSSNKTNLFAVALGSWLDSYAETFNMNAVPRLWTVNGMNPEECPKIIHEDIESPDLPALSSFLQALVATGMTLFPDAKLESWVRKVAGMPERDPNAEAEMEQQQGGMEAGGDMMELPEPTVGEPGTDVPGQVPRTPEENRPPDTTKATLGKSDSFIERMIKDTDDAFSEADKVAKGLWSEID